MSLTTTYLQLRAAQDDAALRSTSFRHYRLETDPWIVTGYHLAGEQAAPVAIMFGRSSETSQIITIPEPRNRDLRFTMLEVFAAELDAYFQQADSDGGLPQVVVANPATANWLFGFVGRFTRGTFPDVEPIISRMGQSLSYLAQEFEMPGSPVALDATTLLSEHFVTGQLPFEDLNLHTQLAWIDPGESGGARSALEAELTCPPAGPVSAPAWDVTLAASIERWREAPSERQKASIGIQIAEACRSQLEPSWSAVARAVSTLAAIPEASGCLERAQDARGRFERHVIRAANGDARFSSRPNASQAANRLTDLESAQEAFSAVRILDDPQLMSELVATGQALEGEVTALDPMHREQVAAKRKLRPRITVATLLPCALAPGTRLRLASDTSVEVELVEADETGVVLHAVRGAQNVNTRDRLPAVGSRAVFSPLVRPGGFWRPDWLADLPWTHVLPTQPEESA